MGNKNKISKNRKLIREIVKIHLEVILKENFIQIKINQNNYYLRVININNWTVNLFEKYITKIER